jgi:hypothetical protein
MIFKLLKYLPSESVDVNPVWLSAALHRTNRHIRPFHLFFAQRNGTGKERAMG